MALNLIPACEECGGLPPYGERCMACGRIGMVVQSTGAVTELGQLQADLDEAQALLRRSQQWWQGPPQECMYQVQRDIAAYVAKHDDKRGEEGT